MTLILLGSTQFGKFIPDFMLPLLDRGYYIEFIVFWKRVGVVGNSRKTTAWLSRFYVVTEILWLCVATGVPYVATGVPCVATLFSGFKLLLCRDIVFPCHDNAFVSLS